MNRKRTIQWILLAIGLFLMLLVAVGIVVMRSQRFHEFVLVKIEQKASEATGGHVTVQNYSFHWRNLSADAYGLVIDGREAQGSVPLLSVDRLFLDVKVVSLFRREVDLREIVVQHPVIHLVTYPDGSTNIPKPKTPSTSSNTSIFDLGIKHVLLTDGEIYYEQRKQNLFADLRDLHTNIAYQMLGNRYQGALSYADGQIRLGDADALPHALQASFTFDRNQAKLESATLIVGGSKLWLNALLENYNAPRLSGTYHLLTHPQDFRELLHRTDLPSGEIQLEGSLNYDSADSRPFMRVVLAEGKITSPNLLVNTPQAHTTIRSTLGRFVLRDAKLTASLHAEVLSGQLTATLDMANLDRTPASYVKASLTGLSLGEARSALRSSNAQNLPITGKIDAYSEASWTGSVSTLRARADLALKGAVSQIPQSGVVPVNGAAHMNYDGRSKMVTLTNTIFRTPQSTITLDGQLSRHSSLKIAARTTDVRELNEIMSSLNASKEARGSRSTLVSGPAALTAVVSGDMQRPEIAGSLSAHDFVVQGDQWKTLSADFQASPAQVVVSRGSLVAMGAGQASFSARAALRNWAYSAENPIAATMQVRGMPIRSLQHVAGVNYPVSGTLAADLNFKGSQLDPTGTGNIHVQQARVYGQTVRDVLVKFNAANRTINSDLAVQTPAGNLNGTISFRPDRKAYEVHLKAPSVALAKVDAVQARNVPVDGTLTLNADGSGTFDDPQLQAAVTIPQLRVKDSTVQSVRSDLQVANHRATFNLDSNFANSFLQGKGTVDLRDDYPAEFTFDTRALPIETLLAVYKPIPNRDFHGEIELHASARGPLKDKSRMEVHVTIPTLRAAYQQIQIANAQPIRADFKDAVLRVQPGQLQGTGTSLRFDGTIPVASTQPASMNLTGSVDLQIVRLIAPDVQSRGEVVLDLRANRSAGNLGIGGQVRLEKVALATLTSPMAVQNLNGTLDISDNQVRITSLQGQTGGGNVTAGGTITYRPQLAMDVSLNAKGVRIRYPEGVRAVIDSDLAISGNQQSSTLSGRVLLGSLGFTQGFDLAEFIGQFSGQPTTAPSAGIEQNMKLDVAVQSTSNLQLVSSELSLEGQVNMRVQGTAAQPVLVGRSTLSNGDLFFRNRRYRLERGILDFANPNQTKPTVNILITTVINQYNLSLTLLGPVDRLRTNYVSDPPLPPVDIINLIARGQTTEATTASNFDANSVLAQGLAGQVSSRLQKFAGLSSLQIDPLLGGSNQDPGARIAVQQRVTKNFLFTFSTDVTNAQREVVQGEYQVNPRWSVSAQRDENGGYAFDAKYRRIF